MFAKNKTTAIFANSAGCIDIGPKLNQLVAPFIALVKSTANSKIIEII